MTSKLIKSALLMAILNSIPNFDSATFVKYFESFNSANYEVFSVSTSLNVMKRIKCISDAC